MSSQRLLRDDFFYFDGCVILTVAIGLAETLASPVFEDQEFLASVLVHDFRGNFGGIESRLADRHLVSIGDHEDIFYFDDIALLGIKALHPDHIAG